MAKFIVYQDAKKEWRWRLLQVNGRVIADSGEGYTEKASAIKGIRSVKRCICDAEITVVNV